MSLASIQQIAEVKKHPNADALDIVRVLGYECIVKRDQYKVGDAIVFIEPDVVLPDAEWTKLYKAKSNRVRAIRLRGSWSFGIVESLSNTGLDQLGSFNVGDDVADLLKVTKYEPPLPQDLSAKGLLPFGIPKTDEERWQSLSDVPYGELCDVTLKVDGQSTSYYCKLDGENVHTGILSRTLEIKPEFENNYTRNEKKYEILTKLQDFCIKNNVSLCIRGESYGSGIQKMSHNPHSKLPLDIAFFRVWLIDERRYAYKGHPFYIYNIAPLLGLPTVPMLEKDVPILPELIKKYDTELTEINGNSFEGVVLNWNGGSFKIISKSYDALK